MGRYPHPIPLYGVPIQDAIATGDRDLMRAMEKVSDFMLAGTRPDAPDLAEWKAAHAALKKANA